MSRLLPSSLFGRLVLVLMLGLIVAQSLSATLSFLERDRAIRAIIGLRLAQRVADDVRVLDAVQPEQRARVADILSSARWHITAHVAAPSPEEVGRVPDERLAAIAGHLHALLGPGVAVRMAAGASRPAPAWWRRAFLHRHPHHPPMVITAHLNDGEWVRVESRFPRRDAPWPSRLFIQLAILLGAVLLLSMIAVTWVTRPLSLLAKAARDLGRNIHRPPLPESGPIEVRRAAQAFNAMQARLVQYIDSRTQLFTAISHDLKTPITRLRLRAEMLDDPELQEKIVRDLTEMESMVASSLDFLRGLNSEEAPRPLDINALLGSLADDAVELGQDVSVTGRARWPFPARAQALKRCLSNLIDNALRYGGAARIAVEDSEAALVLRIRDEGPGIPESELGRVFDPFYRVEGSRNRASGGTGLGLAIARSIVEAHGGSLELGNRGDGGLEATITLPRES
ncbi:MAG TPA: ATP-binding protein [Gammaproteobacteria bacterium]|nr:ATP-binding protein [Gammaproteobacteria bacterium]